MAKQPLFSIILPTRDRAELCIRAIRSITAQTCDDVEIIIIDDGSNTQHREALDAYRAGNTDTAKRFVWHHLPRREAGHGVAFVRNLGADLANGRYLGMLDDDDVWIDETYLAKIAAAITSSKTPPELFFSNQEARRGETLEPGPIWIEPLAQTLQSKGVVADKSGLLSVRLDDLLEINGFCHLNTTIIARTLFHAIKGFDPTLRYESDRDLYLRLIDRAQTIAHLPDVVARHHIPDAKKTDNVSTRVNQLQKRLYQSRFLQNAAVYAQHDTMRRYARRELATVYKHVCEIAREQGDTQTAALFARQALACHFTLKWSLYAMSLSLRGLLT